MSDTVQTLLARIDRDVEELREGRKEVFAKLDKKVDKDDFTSFKTEVGAVALSIEALRKERKNDFKWGVGLVITGVGILCTFFWRLSLTTNDKIDQYKTEANNFKIQILEQNALLDKRTSLIEQQLKSLKLID